MVNSFILDSKTFENLLMFLKDNFKLFTPTGDNSDFEEYKSFDESVFINSRTKNPQKKFLFPEYEVLFKYSKKKEDEEYRSVLPSKRKVLVGLKPCDIKGMFSMDDNFLKEYNDPYYKTRREKTLTFVFACLKRGDYCFCNWFSQDINNLNGADALIFKIDQNYILQTESEEVKEILKTLRLKEAEASFLETIDEFNKTFYESFDEKKIELNPLKEKLKSLMRKKEVWEHIEDTCLNCFACTYYCPACYCFDITDENFGNKGLRIRSWDSCMSTIYTLEASGHNPREENYKKWRQRLLHKFLYYPTLFNKFGCTGCGRCSEVCPSSIDLKEVLEYVAG